MVENEHFNHVVTGVIVLAGVHVGASTYAGAYAAYKFWFDLIDTVISWVFRVEVGLKVTTFNNQHHRRRRRPDTTPPPSYPS